MGFLFLPPRQHPELTERVSVDLVVFRRGIDVVCPRRPSPPTPPGTPLELCLDTPEISIKIVTVMFFYLDVE